MCILIHTEIQFFSVDYGETYHSWAHSAERLTGSADRPYGVTRKNAC